MTLYKTLQNPALVQALAHPLRAKMLYAMQEREASPKELAQHFGVPLSNVAYHIQVLRRLRLIRLVKTTPRRGAVEHHYKVTQIIDVHAEAWGQTPDLIKDRAVAEWLEDIGGYVTEAAATGGFNRSNAHMARLRVVLDGEAWDRLAVKLDEVIDLVEELERASASRLKESNHEDERHTGLVMMMFESMPSLPAADAAQPAGSGEDDVAPARVTSR